VEVIGQWCFCGCRSLEAVTFKPNSQLREIGPKAFTWTSLRDIVIPASVEVIGDNCFVDCRSLCEVTFATDSRLQHIGEHSFARCPSLKSITAPEPFPQNVRDMIRRVEEQAEPTPPTRLTALPNTDRPGVQKPVFGPLRTSGMSPSFGFGFSPAQPVFDSNNNRNGANK
jgi:hypothetical protein